MAYGSHRLLVARSKIRVASPRLGAANFSVSQSRGSGKTLKVISTNTPRRPRLPTKNFGRSKPAAFLTTFPPIRSKLPEPSINLTPKMKSRIPPKRNRRGPLNPAATVPPRVAPASTRSGSKGKYWPRSFNALRIVAIGVPAIAVDVYSLGSYSVTPVSPAVETLGQSIAESRGLVPAPTGRRRGTERTTSINAGIDPGADFVLGALAEFAARSPVSPLDFIGESTGLLIPW